MRRGFCAKAFCAALLLCIQSKTSFKLAAQIHFRTLLFCICAQDVCARRGKKSELIGVKTLLLSNVSALAGRCVYKFNEPKRNVPVGRRSCEVELISDRFCSPYFVSNLSFSYANAALLNSTYNGALLKIAVTVSLRCCW